MFFLFSKLLAFAIKPLNWIVVLAALALFSKSQKRKKKALGWAVGLLVFFTSPVPLNLVLQRFEADPVAAASLQKTWDVGIVLGGYSNFDTDAAPDLIDFSFSGTRFTQAVELFKMGKFRRILLCGGSGKILGDEKREADQSRLFLIKMGVPDSCILVERESRSTFENAIFCQKMLEKGQFGRSFLLITSAWHLPRAAACFRKAGLEFDVFPTDHQAELLSKKTFAVLQPDAEALFKWEFLVKEWLGIAAYRAKGAI